MFGAIRTGAPTWAHAPLVDCTRFAAPGPVIRTSSPFRPTILPPFAGVKMTSIHGRELAERWLSDAPANGLGEVRRGDGRPGVVGRRERQREAGR